MPQSFPVSGNSTISPPAVAPGETTAEGAPERFNVNASRRQHSPAWWFMPPVLGALTIAADFLYGHPLAGDSVMAAALLNLALLIVVVAMARRRLKDMRVTKQLLRTERERFRQLVETTSDWLWEVDENAIYTYSSPRVYELLGYEAHEILGKTPFALMPPEEAERVGALFGPIAARHEAFAGLENTNRHKQGHLVVLETSGVPVFDESGMFRGYRGVDRDITERKRISDRLAQLAHTDSLTGLSNRALFQERLHAAIEHVRNRGRHMAVLLLDLDGFKQINDTLGHATGDRLLQSVAQRLAGAVRADDTVARLGGDEFVILLVDVAHREDVAHVAQKIINALALPHAIDGCELIATASIGVSLFPGDGEDGASLMKQADIAMYRAKANGRNNFQMYVPDADYHRA